MHGYHWSRGKGINDEDDDLEDQDAEEEGIKLNTRINDEGKQDDFEPSDSELNSADEQDGEIENLLGTSSLNNDSPVPPLLNAKPNLLAGLMKNIPYNN